MLAWSGAEDKALEEQKEQMRYGGKRSGRYPDIWKIWGKGHHTTAEHSKFFGLTVVSCERGDIRQSPGGLYGYNEEGRTEIEITDRMAGRQAEVTELYEAVVNSRPVSHDGRWAEATLEVCLGILESASERREIFMTHQVPVGD